MNSPPLRAPTRPHRSDSGPGDCLRNPGDKWNGENRTGFDSQRWREERGAPSRSWKMGTA